MGLAKRFLAEERGDKPIPARVLKFFGMKPKKAKKDGRRGSDTVRTDRVGKRDPS